MDKRLLMSLGLLVILSGCLLLEKERGHGDSIDSEKKAGQDDFLAGMRLFNGRDYQGARKRFSSIIGKYPGIKLLHDAQWMIARSYEEEGDLKNAIEEYKLFLRNYPDSSHFRETGLKIESMEKARDSVIKKVDDKIIGIKFRGGILKALNLKDISLLHQSGTNTIIVELPAATKLLRDDLKSIIDSFHKHGFQIFIEINIRDPRWLDDPEAIGSAYDPASRKIVKSDGLDLFNRDILANIAGICRNIASGHPDGIILKGYDYGRYEGLGKYAREEFYKDFGLQLEPEHLFMIRPDLSNDNNQNYSPDFWRWSGWKGRRIYKAVGRIMQGCKEADRSIKFILAFHREAIDDPSAALALYSEDILEAGRYGPDYLLVVIPGDQLDISLLSKRFSRYVSHTKLLFEIILDDSAHLVNTRSYLSNINMIGHSGIIFSGDGGGFQDLDLF